MEYPHLEFEFPTSHYHEDEAIRVVMLPASGGRFEVQLSSLPHGIFFDLLPQKNRITVNAGLPPGDYFIKARWKGESSSQESWTRWSLPLRFTIHHVHEDLSSVWEQDHRLSLMLERGMAGVITLIDPEAEPPARVGLSDPKWFPTPVYEGATPLVNEEREYYQDPLAYYFDCIDLLVSSGARFITWHDVMEGKQNEVSTEILLQFDVDGGPRSMRRIYEGLASRGICATLMLHRRGHYWYPYDLEDLGIDWIRDAERLGWAVGYHNNALSQVMGENPVEPDEYSLREAVAIFERDVDDLRKYFSIRSFTHHGGNVHNLKIAPPQTLDITGVDRALAPDLWRPIRTMFSDGGFVSRPTTLRQKIKSLTPGLHFFRNHPFKYGNYVPPVDTPPRFQDDFQRAGLENDQPALKWRKQDLDKEARWLKQRNATRSKVRLAYLRVEKPISSRFKPYSKVEARVTELRKHRGPAFMRLYPWSEGDPRVFWWRMLEAWAPKSGELLNVGVLSPDEKFEHTAFLSPGVVVRDVDINKVGEPDYLFDICDAPDSLNNTFAGTMLFRLPYFASPSAAVAACARITMPSGTGLFGFEADNHPVRGSLWHPKSRCLWRKEKEPLTNTGGNRKLWAFDEAGLQGLFHSWDQIKFEFMGHYWFVVAHKEKIDEQ